MEQEAPAGAGGDRPLHLGEHGALVGGESGRAGRAGPDLGASRPAAAGAALEGEKAAAGEPAQRRVVGARGGGGDASRLGQAGEDGALAGREALGAREGGAP